MGRTEETGASPCGRYGWRFSVQGSWAVLAGPPTIRGDHRPGHDRGDGAHEAWSALQVWAESRKLSALVFGLEPADLGRLRGLNKTAFEVGRQPLFEAGWFADPTLTGVGQPSRGKELRRQARRALRKGVTAQALTPAQLWPLLEDGTLEPLMDRRWHSQRLPEFRFLLDFRWSDHLDRRRFYLCRDREGEPICLGVLLRCDRGWLLEHQLLGPKSPNGTTELLLCHLLSSALEPGQWLSLGLTPLAGSLPPEARPWSESDVACSAPTELVARLPSGLNRRMFDVFERLYRFRSLAQYRRKLQPDRWEPVYLAAPTGSRRGALLLALLRAFAGGSLLRFALRTVEKEASRLTLLVPARLFRLTNRLFFWTLMLWILLLPLLSGLPLFGHPQGAWVWACYDLLPLFGFWIHGRTLADRPHPKARVWRAALMGLVAGDALLSWLGTLWQYGGLPEEGWLALISTVINSAPLLALAFLGLCSLRDSTPFRFRTPVRGVSLFMKGR